MKPNLFAWAGLLLGAWLIAWPAAAQNQEPEKPKLTLTFWHAWPEDQSWLESLAAQYRAQTQVRIIFRAFPAAGGRNQNPIQNAARTRTLPDLLGFSGDPALLAVYVRSGLLRDLTPALRADGGVWEKAFYPQILRQLSFAPGNPFGLKPGLIWGVPLGVETLQWYYNRLLFQKAGLNPDVPPQTREEFTSVCQALQAAGIAPLAGGFSDPWILRGFFLAYARSLMGDDKMQSLFQGRFPYLALECQQVLNYFSELRNKGYLLPGSSTRTSRDAEALFAAQKAAMLLDRSGAAPVLLRLAPTLDFGIMPFPKFKESAGPIYAEGSLQQAAAVTTQCQNVSAALDFLRWLTADAQASQWMRNRNGQTSAGAEWAGPKLKPFSPGWAELPPDLKTEERRDVLAAITRGMQAILAGESEPLDVLRQVQKIKAGVQPAKTSRKK